MGAFHAYDIRGVYNVDFDKASWKTDGERIPAGPAWPTGTAGCHPTKSTTIFSKVSPMPVPMYMISA